MLFNLVREIYQQKERDLELNKNSFNSFIQLGGFDILYPSFRVTKKYSYSDPFVFWKQQTNNTNISIPIPYMSQLMTSQELLAVVFTK